MATVLITPEAQRQFDSLPVTIKVRVLGVFERLELWPTVSGAKPLRGNLANHHRIRTGNYRVQFSVVGGVVTIEKIGHRDSFYD